MSHYLDENGLSYVWQKIKSVFVQKETGKGLSTNDYTTSEKNKLAGIESGAEVNVQSNWSQNDNTKDDFIKNKPTLSTVATSGSYEDLSNKPTLGTSSTKDVAASGNASASQVVMGNDTRLSDARPASDVSSWAKANTKPSYTASEVGAIASSLKGANNGVAELDATGKVPSGQLPSYVDDVLEYTAKSSFPTTGESGKIYVDTSTNITYRWGGSDYVEISPSLALGETSSTAYRGDRGKTAYDHSQSTHARTDATAVSSSSTNGNIKINGTETTVYTHPGSGTNPHGTTKSDVGLGKVGNFKAVSTAASQGLTDTEKANARSNIGAGTSNFSGNYNDLSNKPTIPTKVSELTNDSGYTTNTGTITGITMNGTSKGTNGVVDLGTVITSHQDISGKANKQKTIDTYYGTCSTAAATAAKVITVTDDDSNFTLRPGICILVKFTYTNTAQNPTFNVNNTGAKSVWYNTALITTGSLGYGGTANRPMQFVYDGTQWVFVSWSYDANTTYSAMSTSELTTGTATNSRSVRADYLKAGIESIAESSAIDTANNTVTFTQATTRSNVASGESHATIFGKIMKWFSDLSAVSFSGSYNDLSDKPTIGNATLTIQKNGTTVKTFKANATSNVTANITVPTLTVSHDGDKTVTINFS